MGYTNIKIYNGGIKDWSKSGFPLESRSPLPDVDVHFIETEPFFNMLQELESRQCRDHAGAPLLTILDFRNANHLTGNTPPPTFITSCPIKTYKLDDLHLQDIRNELPATGKLITVTETGNRDEFVIRYLSQYGFKTITGLKFGMRGWFKLRYPTR